MSMEKAASSQEAAGCKLITAFVQTDTNAFREVVQRLTGPVKPIAPTDQTTKVGTTAGVKRTTSNLHERRQCRKPRLEIVKPAMNFKPAASVPPSPASGNSCASLIPSPLTPSTIISRLSILDEERKGVASILEVDAEEEEKAIRERRFYLHPSPRAKPGYPEPELLPLFPLEFNETSR